MGHGSAAGGVMVGSGARFALDQSRFFSLELIWKYKEIQRSKSADVGFDE